MYLDKVFNARIGIIFAWKMLILKIRLLIDERVLGGIVASETQIQAPDEGHVLVNAHLCQVGEYLSPRMYAYFE